MAPEPGPPMHDGVVDLYERNAAAWIADRGDRPTGDDRAMVDRLTAGLPRGAAVLDVGCGHGRPIAAELLRRGYAVTGLDGSPTLIERARLLPGGEWLVGDMRDLALGRRFDAVLAWCSFFHLGPDDQRATLPRLAAHLAPGGRLLFASGPAAGVAIGRWRGEPLHHASLSPDEYRRILQANGCVVEHYRPGEPVGVGPTVWTARRVGRRPPGPIRSP